ncbi:MAG: aminotransferase, partial [Candidatus Hydrogenedentes bacterium]|nr:aminotransferase [Candidatus Hydrogenedentota bacterium]
MRRNIVHMGAGSLSYEIREIVAVARQISAAGQEITWENIGDPVQKGEKVEPWMREIIHDLVDRNESWAYCDSAGVPATREFLASHVNARPGGVQITSDDIMFFNG